jgi:hypothetical protein
MRIVDEVKAEDTKHAEKQNVIKVVKNVVLAHYSDHVGSGTIRAIWPFNYLGSLFGKQGTLLPHLTQLFTRQSDILIRVRTMWFQRNMSPEHLTVMKEYRRLQEKLQYRMVYDMDDLVFGHNEEWGGTDIEGIPSYNFASDRVTDENRDVVRECMDVVDIVTVSTPYLKKYLENMGVKTRIEVVLNTVPRYMYSGKIEKQEIQKDIEKPVVLYNGSPTHYSNTKKMKGDLNNAWSDWVLKAVKEDKITFVCMGGCPWFWEEIKDKIRVIDWLPAFNYPFAMKQINPDFVISPLTYNHFNQSKSDIKTIEAQAIGAIPIGTVFSNGEESPYDNNLVKVFDNCTVEDIEEVIRKYSQKDEYNLTVAKGYQKLEDEARWTESPKFIRHLTSII